MLYSAFRRDLLPGILPARLTHCLAAVSVLFFANVQWFLFNSLSSKREVRGSLNKATSLYFSHGQPPEFSHGFVNQASN